VIKLAGESSDAPAEPAPAPPPQKPAAQRSRRVVHTVLLIDADVVSRRFVELALARDPDLEVEGAVDGAGAMEILSSTPVHLIISETDFSDMNGLQFFRRLSQGMRLRSVPFVFFTADARVTTKVVALTAGVDDYLVKPCEGAELVARVRSLLNRQRRTLAGLRSRGYSLAGEFSALSFADLVSILELGRRSGTVAVVTKDRVGTVYFDRGRIVHAVFGSMVGPPAFVWLLAQEEGHFEFSPGPCTIAEAERTIWESVQSLMMESARVIDIRRASGWDFLPGHEAVPAGAPAGGTDPSTGPPFVPDAATAGQLEEALKGAFTLGDLHIFTRNELAAWTEKAPARERFHVLVVGDPAKGISSMLPLAGAPSERWVLNSLSAEVKAMGLSFFLRRERLIDILLLDIQEPAQFLPCLRRAPSLLIVAPPDGDGLGLGTKARFQLSEIVAYLRPQAILGVGNPALETAIRAVVDMGRLKRGPDSAAAGWADQGSPNLPAMVRAENWGSGQSLAIRCLPGVLGDPPHDLRLVLCEGIRLCAGLEPATDHEG
jgi:DNA-binding response OmpR family regulator